MTGLEPVNTVFGPFLRDPVKAIARELREAIEGMAAHCAIHGVPEPGPAYLVCFECGHAFPTPEALLADHNALVARLNAADVEPPGGPVEPIPEEIDSEHVTVCPHCSHDL